MIDPTPMPDPYLLPGDAHPRLLPGWVGPAVMPDGERVVIQLATIDGRVWVVGSDRSLHNRPYQPHSITLDLHRPECADRVIRVLAAGVECGCWQGWTRACGPDGEPSGEPCPDCGTAWAPGTGYSIAPADLDWTRDLPAWQAGPILAASVLRVVAGEGPVAGLLTRVSPAYALAAGYALDCGAFILTPLTNGAVARVEA